ncbi:hypothetical protein PV08_01149 [Exophiala spinifera]|uniref:peptidyl-tRNA hydrolase n=1 Tax=Exophiala spinifera TaxID=91928 RepID=A0A0D2CAI0_9EURO|nr:uncharacterized protein PV08_01149 [Exophiala spinifera]KIW20574.1 hypothetical protein PV08_01149 [Exophiala spinifera]
MTDSDAVAAHSHQYNVSFSHDNTFVQYHDIDNNITWAEPVDDHDHDHDQFVPDSAPLLIALPQPPRKHVKRRSVGTPITSITTTTPPLSSVLRADITPIIPAPLRIRRPKHLSSTMPPSPARQVRLLIASIGNPPPYHTTRHSAGHLVLKSLSTHLSLPPLSRSKVLGSGSVSLGSDRDIPEYTLWQSASLMNVSGTGTLRAWKQFTSLSADGGSSQDTPTALVILHDELESSIGTIKLRRGETSAKGHNGIKSIQASFKSAGLLPSMGDRFIKLGIGIGRPQSREKDDVSAWVLGQLTSVEKAKVEAAAESVTAVLKSEVSRLERL